MQWLLLLCLVRSLHNDITVLWDLSKKSPQMVAAGLANPRERICVTCRSCLTVTYVSGHNPVDTESRPDTTAQGLLQQTLCRSNLQIIMHDSSFPPGLKTRRARDGANAIPGRGIKR